jgi:hypothetical protein
MSSKKEKVAMIKLIFNPFWLLIYILPFNLFCSKSDIADVTPPYNQRVTKSITYNNVSVDVVIDMPGSKDVDVLIVYHGTVFLDSKIMDAANNVLDKFKALLDKEMMIVSVAYPEENLLMGDNILHSEAALLWVKNRASEQLGVNVKRIFLAGHSQGGYIVTRLNTMHQTNGVIANAPGPLNLVYRCNQEELGLVATTVTCNLLRGTYGTTSSNPGAYFERSLLNFTQGFKSDILFVQGLNDSPIQMYSWPLFKSNITECTNCKMVKFLDLPNYGHASLFESPQAKSEFNKFLK